MILMLRILRIFTFIGILMILIVSATTPSDVRFIKRSFDTTGSSYPKYKYNETKNIF